MYLSTLTTNSRRSLDIVFSRLPEYFGPRSALRNTVPCSWQIRDMANKFPDWLNQDLVWAMRQKKFRSVNWNGSGGREYGRFDRTDFSTSTGRHFSPIIFRCAKFSPRQQDPFPRRHARTTTARATRVHSSSDISRYKLQATRVDTDRLVTYVTPRGGQDKYDHALSGRRHATSRRARRKCENAPWCTSHSSCSSRCRVSKLNVKFTRDERRPTPISCYCMTAFLPARCTLSRKNEILYYHFKWFRARKRGDNVEPCSFNGKVEPCGENTREMLIEQDGCILPFLQNSEIFFVPWLRGDFFIARRPRGLSLNKNRQNCAFKSRVFEYLGLL